MRIHVFQHIEFEGPAYIAEWAMMHGHTIATTRFFDGALPPSQESVDMLVIMGGPMGIYDYADYLWLAEEKAFIRQTIQQGKPVLGICLGAQLIADVLGAKVYKNAQKEIGWYSVRWSEEFLQHPMGAGLGGLLDVLHWHGDTFDNPEGAILLGSSKACVNQGFLYKDHVLALQFHLEMDRAAVTRIVTECGHELAESGVIQQADEILQHESSYGECQRVLECFLEYLSDD